MDYDKTLILLDKMARLRNVQQVVRMQINHSQNGQDASFWYGALQELETRRKRLEAEMAELTPSGTFVLEHNLTRR